jgi:hypothetical protein
MIVVAPPPSPGHTKSQDPQPQDSPGVQPPHNPPVTPIMPRT